MAIWSKKSNEAPAAPASSDASTSNAAPLAQPSPPSSLNGSAGSRPEPNVPNATAPLGASDAQKRRNASFGELVMLLSASPQHRGYSLGDLEWLVAPPLRLGQFLLAEASSKDKGYLGPAAAILWADVSPDVDARLMASVDRPFRLNPQEWKCGDIRWVIEVVGDQNVAGQVLQRLVTTEWKGNAPKVRVINKDGKPAIGRFEVKPQAEQASKGS